VIQVHRQNIEQFRTAFPDLELDFKRIMVSGVKKAQRFTCRGTHLGQLMGTPSTGESVEFPAVGITV
jgi:predicted ester cyclase